MEILRTPDAAFAGLEGFAYEPNYTQVGELRIHHVDEGPSDAPVVLLLHGEPSWSYLYRKMIPPLVAAGLRAVAPDFVGFGRTDKPAAVGDYTYARHVSWIKQWLVSNQLDEIALFGQDWGGLIGLRLVAEMSDRFARIAVANTGLPTGNTPPGEAFLAWREFSQTVDLLDVGRIVNGGCVTDLSAEVRASYDAPFPDESYKAGARAFPVLVPITPDDPASAANRAAWAVLREWRKPFLTLFSDSDPITAGVDKAFRARIPGADSQPHQTIEGAGHFLQEDKGSAVAEALVNWIDD